MRQLNRKELLKFKSTCARLFKEFSNSYNEFENNKILLPCCALAYWFRTDCGLAIFDKLRMPAWDDHYAKLGYGDQETALNIIHKLSDDTKRFLLHCAEKHQDLCIELTKAIRASELKAAVRCYARVHLEPFCVFGTVAFLLFKQSVKPHKSFICLSL